MAYLFGAVVIVGALGLLNLILILGILKRLREQGMQAGDARAGVLPAGSNVGDFTATAVDGRPVSLDTMPDGAVVAFFSPTCRPCQELLPAFTEYASHAPGGRDQIIAVVVGEPDEAAGLVSLLKPMATVLTAGGRDEPIVTSFGASGYPAIYLMGERGMVVASGHTMEVLPEPALL